MSDANRNATGGKGAAVNLTSPLWSSRETVIDRKQIAAVAGLRCRLLLNSLRKPDGKIELLSRIIIGFIFLAGALGAAVGLAAAAWYLTLAGNIDSLGTLLWPVFLFWQLFPVIATAFTENLDSSNLLRFPTSYRTYGMIRLAYGLLDPAATVSILWLAGISIGVGVARRTLFLWTAVVLMVFALVNLLLARVIFAWLERWLANRKMREILGLLFFTIVLGLQLVSPLLSRHGHGARPETKILGLPYLQRPLPPGITAAAIAAPLQGRAGAGLAYFLLLCSYGVTLACLLHLRLRAEYRGESLSEATPSTATPVAAADLRPGWRVPGLPGPMAAVLEKELLYLSRSGPMLFTLLVPLVLLLVFRSSVAHGGLLSLAPNLTFPIAVGYSLILLTNLSYNNLGADGGGVQFFFAAPVGFGQIMAGKNLAHTAVFVLETILVWLGTWLLYRPPALTITLATLAAVLLVLPLDLAAGNLLSVYSPTRIEAGVFGRQRASLTTVLASFAIRGILISSGAMVFWRVCIYRGSWTQVLLFVLPSTLAISFYVLVLYCIDRIAQRLRENVIAAVGRI